MARKPTIAIAVGVGKPKGPPDDMAPEDMPLPGEGEATEEAPEAPGEAPEEPESEGEEQAEGSYPEFDIPEGLDLSDIEPGEEKDVMCKIRKVSDTEACFKEVDGVDLAGTPTGGMAGPPPGPAGPPAGPPGAPPGAPPPELLAAMMGGGGPPPGLPPGPPELPGGPVRRRAAAAGLM